jgi:hypothetical protein
MLYMKILTNVSVIGIDTSFILSKADSTIAALINKPESVRSRSHAAGISISVLAAATPLLIGGGLARPPPP